MKLEELKTFNEQLKADLHPEEIDHCVYYYHNECWNHLESQSKVDEYLITTALEKAKTELSGYHIASDFKAWYYFENSDCGVSIGFKKSPRKETRSRYRTKLDKIKESSTNAYKVSHNSLTHLLSKDAFRQKLEASISDLRNSIVNSEEAQESNAPKTLAVLALDLDHFKQVNDTWGHLYGDLVLKAFGMRVEKIAQDIVKETNDKPIMHLGHPSGEEFLILIEANVTREKFVEWSNIFCSRIAEEPLPTDIDFGQLTALDDGFGIALPPLQDRTITTSIGVALHSHIGNLETGPLPSSVLLDRADTALYRAKAAGRNQVIFYDEILSSCGRILEIHNATRVVAIDIGANVGVSIGQEFKVFSPTFNGKKKFSINDGRTTRILGLYPKVPSGRLIVFNTQAEVSFAYIDAPETETIELDIGSELEAIPAGSIGHLLPTNSKYFPMGKDPLGGVGLQNLQTFINSAANEKLKPFAIVIRFTHESDFLRKYGTAALNAALAKVYRSAQATFHAAKGIEVVDSGSICVAGKNSAYQEEMVTTFVNDAAEGLPELGLYAGIFCEKDYASKSHEGSLSAKNAIDFARFAASDFGRSADSRTRHFNHTTANKMLHALRESRSYDIAYTDFKRLRELGVESASLMNLGGLIASALGLRKEAAELYAFAISKNPSNLIYKGNYGTACYRLGDIESGLKVLNSLSADETNKLKTDHAYAYVTYARMLAEARLKGYSSYNNTRFMKVATEALSLPDFKDDKLSLVIKEALNFQSSM